MAARVGPPPHECGEGQVYGLFRVQTPTGGETVEEICRFELGRWSAAVMKVELGTFKDMPEATLVELRCNGV